MRVQFGLVSTQNVYPFDDYIGHGNHVPTAPSNLFPVSNAINLNPPCILPLGPGTVHAVPWGDFLVHLTIRSDLETQVMFVVEDLPRQDGFGAQSSRDATSTRVHTVP
jgi:hypothetical protein